MSIDALIQAHIEALNTNTKAVELLTLSLAGRTPTKTSKADAEKIAEGIADAEAGNLIPLEDVKAKHVAKTRGTSHAEAAVDVKENGATKDVAHDPKVVECDENEDPVIEDVGDKVAPTPYETVRALVLKLAPTQRDAIKALNAKHGIANLKVLLGKEDDYSTVNDQAKLEAVYADLQALEA